MHTGVVCEKNATTPDRRKITFPAEKKATAKHAYTNDEAAEHTTEHTTPTPPNGTQTNPHNIQ